MSTPDAAPEAPENEPPSGKPAVDDASRTPFAKAGGGELGSLDPRNLIEAGLRSQESPLRWEPPSAEELHRLLPQYEIEAILGRGGMGAVYKGRQAALDRPVAIKLLPAEMAATDEFVARFQREARTLAKLHHPGIVLVHDFGQTSEGHLYFVMEFVDGTDLHKIIHGPGLACAQALEIVTQICDALQYAHSQGVVHRDIKPANVILTQDGRTKLADFGLARPLDDGSGAFTRSNVVMGTPDYMAPEALAGEADHRADLYSLGVMLYEMLTGKPPRGAWPPPSQRVQIDVRLDQVVLRALQEDPAMRYQQASEIKTDVDVIRSTPVGKAPRKKAGDAKSNPRRASDVAARIMMLLLLIAIGASVWFFAGFRKTRTLVPEETIRSEVSQGGEIDEVVAVAPVLAARERGGRLRVFGHRSDRPIELGNTSAFDDFVEVSIGNGAWVARRANGEAYGQAALQLTEPKKIGPIYTTHLLRGLGDPWMRMTDGSFGHLLNGDFQGVFDPGWTDTAGYLLAYGSSLVLASDGSIHDWVGGWDVPGRARPPVDFFRGASAWASGDNSFVAADQLNGVRSFRADGTLTNFPAAFQSVVEMDAGRDHVVMRSSSGEVFVSDGVGQPYEFGAKPLDLDPAVAIRAGCRMSAAQMADGTWRAWGESSDLISQVQKIGHAIDLDLHSDGPKVAYMMWIEPVTKAAPDTVIQSESPLLTATKDTPFVNSLGMKFVPVPGTDILMCIHETRRKDYAAYSDTVPNVDATWKSPSDDGILLIQDDNHPVVEVSWEDVSAFCNWLSEKEGRTYRLPTEREWNLAVAFDVKDPRSISDANLKASMAFPRPQYPWGTMDETDAPRYGNYSGEIDGYVGMAPVMSFLPNRLGIFDLGGNVWEWCDGWFDKEQSKRVLIGCGYKNYGSYRNSLTRQGRDPSYRFPVPPLDDYSRNLVPGFRCVVELTPPEIAAKLNEQKPGDSADPQWIPLKWSSSSALKSSLTPSTGGWWEVKNDYISLPGFPPDSLGGDFAMRISFRNGSASGIRLGFRISENSGLVHVTPNKLDIAMVMALEGKTRTILAKSAKRLIPESGDREELLEVAVIGNTVLARLAGGPTVEAVLTDLPQRGGININFTGGFLGEIQRANLDGIPDPLKALGWEVPEAEAATKVSWQKARFAFENQVFPPNPDGWHKTGVDPNQLHFHVSSPDGSYLELANVAIRFTFRWSEDNGGPLSVFLRHSNKRDGLNGHVEYLVHKDRLVVRRNAVPGAEVSLAKVLSPGDEAQFEIISNGDSCYARLNGLVVPFDDGYLRPSGQILVGGWKAQFKDLEYTLLDGIPDPLKALGWEEAVRDALPQPLVWKEQLWSEEIRKTSLQPADEGWHRVTQDSIPLSGFGPGAVLGNFAVRIPYGWREAGRLVMHVRHEREGNPYGIINLTPAKLEIALRDERPSSAKSQAVQSWTTPALAQPIEDGVLEIAVIGSRVFARRPSSPLLQAELPDLPLRGGAILNFTGGLLGKVERANLDDIADPLKALGWEVPETEAAAGEPWRDFLAELADGPHKNGQLGRVWIPENGNWRAERYHIFTIPDEAGRDLAVRISGVVAPGKGPAGTPGNFTVHCRKKGDGDGYTGILFNTGNAYIRRGAEDLKRFDLGPDFDPTASHTLELRAVGNRLTLLVDGIEQMVWGWESASR